MTEKKIGISIIMLNYNGGELLLENIDLLHSTFNKNLDIEFILADNGSADGSFEKAKKRFPWVIPVDNKENLGFAAGNNRAVPKAKGDYVVFINTDIKVTDTQVWSKLIALMEKDSKIGGIGCKVIYPNGSFDSDSYRSFPTPWNSLTHFSGLAKLFKGNYLFDSYHLGYLDPEQDHVVEAVPGAFFFVRRQAGEDVGWWDEDYFFYGDDLEFCFSLKEKGWKVYYTAATSVIHYKGYSSGIRKESAAITPASQEGKKRIAKASVEAMRIFYKKHYNKKYPFFVSWLVGKTLDLLEKQRVGKYS